MVVLWNTVATDDNCRSDVPCEFGFQQFVLSFHVDRETGLAEQLTTSSVLGQLGLLAVDAVFDTHGSQGEVCLQQHLARASSCVCFPTLFSRTTALAQYAHVQFVS